MLFLTRERREKDLIVRALYVRLQIRSWYRHISLRVELYGCVIGMLAICDYLFMIIKPANPILANCINISVCKLTTGWNIVNVIVPLKAERFSFFETVEKEMKKYYRVLHLRVFF